MVTDDKGIHVASISCAVVEIVREIKNSWINNTKKQSLVSWYMALFSILALEHSVFRAEAICWSLQVQTVKHTNMRTSACSYAQSHTHQMRDLLHELADDEHLYCEPRQNGKIKALTKKKKKEACFWKISSIRYFVTYCFWTVMKSTRNHY